jgi:hypothetical protein
MIVQGFSVLVEKVDMDPSHRQLQQRLTRATMITSKWCFGMRHRGDNIIFASISRSWESLVPTPVPLPHWCAVLYSVFNTQYDLILKKINIEKVRIEY